MNYVKVMLLLIKNTFATLLLLLCLPLSAQALGFGTPILKSHLNEVLDVQVPLILADGESLNHVFIAFAAADEYKIVGLEPFFNISSMRVAVERLPNGKPYVALTSLSAIQMPIISLLLKARMDHHTHYKHIQILLDTMEMGGAQHQAKQPADAPDDKSLATVEGDHPEHDGWARTWRYGPVRSGDSLSTIAYRLRKDKQWSNHDVMLALYRFNPDAFIDHDMNRLKSGVWLEVPHAQVLQELLQQPAKAYESKQSKAQTPSGKTAPVTADTLPVSKVNDEQAAATSSLRYVGRIALGDTPAEAPVEQDTLAKKGAKELQDKLNRLYEQAMDEQLKMVNLDTNITAIREELGRLGNDIVSLKEQQTLLQQQMLQTAGPSYWMMGFLFLCLLNLIGIAIFLYYRYEGQKRPEPVEQEEIKAESSMQQVEDKIPAVSEKQEAGVYLLENKIYDIENYLNIRDYQAVEDILAKLSQAERNHFTICALKARLYHETGREHERDALIRNKQATLNDKQWHLLCDRLPINLWHALNESGVITGNVKVAHYSLEEEKDQGVSVKKVPDIVISPNVEDGEHQLSSESSHKLDVDDSTAVEALDDTMISTDNVLMPPILETPDIDAEFLVLDDVEFQTMDENAAHETEPDEFASTIAVLPHEKDKGA